MYEEISSNLKFLSNIQTGDKINIKFMILQKPGIMTTFNRYLHGECRINTLNFIRITIDRTFDIINTYTKSKITPRQLDKDKEKYLCQHLIQSLKLAKNGMNKMKETYISDIKFCCDIEVIAEKIDSKLYELRNHHLLIDQDDIAQQNTEYTSEKLSENNSPNQNSQNIDTTISKIDI
jgi:hypothetical protein